MKTGEEICEEVNDNGYNLEILKQKWFSEEEVREAIEKVFGNTRDLVKCASSTHTDEDNWPVKNECPNWRVCEDPFYSYCGCLENHDFATRILKELGLGEKDD